MRSHPYLLVGATAVFILLLFQNCTPKRTPKYTVHPEFESIEWLFDRQSSDTLYLINFWATTCPPCIREMKWFEELNTELGHRPFHIDLINIDGAKSVDTRVFPFLKKNKIPFDVYILTDDNYTKWTDKVNSKWYGALPYTVLYRGDKRDYLFGAFDSYEDLKSKVLGYLE